MLPDLVIREAQPGDVLLPDDAEDEVRSWIANPGFALFGYSARTYDWIHVPGQATFRFRPDSVTVVAFAEDDLGNQTLEGLYERSVLPLVLQAAGRQVLHASAVRAGDDVVALAGVSTAGKSTLAAALAHRGFPLWADDAVAFSVDRDDTVLSTPLPFSPRLRAGYVPAQRAQPTRRPAEARLTRIVLLRPDERRSGDVELEPLPLKEAFPALLPHAYCFSLGDRERNREMIHEYLQLVERVSVWTLRFQRRPEELPQISNVLARFAATTE